MKKGISLTIAIEKFKGIEFIMNRHKIRIRLGWFIITLYFSNIENEASATNIDNIIKYLTDRFNAIDDELSTVIKTRIDEPILSKKHYKRLIKNMNKISKIKTVRK